MFSALSALLRRIDLVTNLLAPIVTGQLITYGSPVLGAIVIAVWNIISMFVEYGLLHMIYYKIPELAIKEKPQEGDVSTIFIYPVETPKKCQFYQKRFIYLLKPHEIILK